jgi:hypothetical protein
LQHFRSQNNVTREAVHYHSDCNHVTTDLRPFFSPLNFLLSTCHRELLFCFGFFFFWFFPNLFAFTILNSRVSYTDFNRLATAPQIFFFFLTVQIISFSVGLSCSQRHL